MSASDRLFSIEKLDKMASDPWQHSNWAEGIKALSKQLADTIRENDALKGAALSLIMQLVPDGEKHSSVQNRHIKALADAIRDKE